MCSWLVSREAVERRIADPEDFEKHLQRKIQLQNTDTCRLSDIGFALSFAPIDVLNRSEAMEFVSKGLIISQLPSEGYAVGEGEKERDPVATAHALRCLSAHDIETRVDDWKYLETYLADSGADPYVQCLILYIMVSYNFSKSSRNSFRLTYRRLMDRLSIEFAVNTEANYEYTRRGEQDYVRIPWQLYLMQAAVRLYPYSRFFAYAMQAKLTETARAAASHDGFRYGTSGSWLSTRTQACVYLAMREIEAFNLAGRLPRLALRAHETTTRFTGSRLANRLMWSFLIAFAIYSAVSFLDAPGHSVGDLAPNFIVSLILFLLARTGSRSRRWRR
jgi:hypothetical protein